MTAKKFQTHGPSAVFSVIAATWLGGGWSTIDMLATKAGEDINPKQLVEECAATHCETRSSGSEMNQEAYSKSRDKLITSLNETDAILRELREFNRDQWVLRYPTSSDSSTPLSVLRLELKLGAAGHSTTLVDSLEKSSVGQLLDQRMERSVGHLNNLRLRITDTQSKVLITGDLNAGKSTFINALMRRSMMPVDQQPCTTVFCEIHDAVRENNGQEEVHVVRDAQAYSIQDESTYTRRKLEEIEAVFDEEDNNESSQNVVLKCYCTQVQDQEASLLHNDAVDIALIDGPGLNRDSVRTTALFAREEQIDVVVFVVSAENHFTLSACEFLQNASNDKAYVFVVVNKYDQIKNKTRCRQRVMEQIRELSPLTYKEADELVHFVDSRAMLEEISEERLSSLQQDSFKSLETNLCEFVLRRRAKSKLLPAQTFLERTLNDILFLARLNIDAAKKDIQSAQEHLAKSRPALADCEANAIKAQRSVESEEDHVVSKAGEQTQASVSDALDKVGRGESAHASIALPAYPGLFQLWDYASDVRAAFVASLQAVVNECEDSARNMTTDAVSRISSTGQEFLPKDIEVPQRVFVPEAMFAKKSTHLAGLGVSLDIVAVRISDMFDIEHHLSFLTQDTSNDEKESSLVSSMSIGLGAMTLVGTQSLGLKTAIDAFVRVTDLLGSRTARRWAGPALLLVSLGALTWVVMDLPQAIPRNVGRHLKRELKSGRALRSSSSHPAILSNSTDAFASIHSMRVTRETRKVLRLASWDLQEKFRVAISQRRSDVERAEQQEKVAQYALKWFNETATKSANLSEEAQHAIDVSML
ncbi:mitofusin [Malassezia yamatoensis]|uniref:Mitofusin n=1 Tax=Malassezia yamatoensis TaxID=253288 RepID=A0AAJ5YUW8_9BASI|nr:mitofusin [Malassezia yamatoensis]